MKKLLVLCGVLAAVTLSAAVIDVTPATHLNRWWLNCYRDGWSSFYETQFDGKTVMCLYCVFPELWTRFYANNSIICNFHGAERPAAIKAIKVECANDAMSHLTICVLDATRQIFVYTMKVTPSEKLQTVTFNFKNHDRHFLVTHNGGKNDGTFHWPCSGIVLRVDADPAKFLCKDVKFVHWYFGKVEVVTE